MPSLEEHRKNLARYRNLLGATRDRAVREVLTKLIAETEAAMKGLEPERRSLSGRPSSRADGPAGEGRDKR